jgi:hypothetical protein
MPGHYVEAIIRYLTTEEGGRRTPVGNGHRGQFHYEADGETPHDGFQFFPDLQPGEPLPLGQAARARVWFPQDRWDDLHRHRIQVGMRFQIQEGSRVVGRGEVTKVDAEPPESLTAR